MTVPILVGLDPTADVRTRRNWQIISAIVDSLLLSGAVIQTGPGAYVFNFGQGVLFNDVFGTRTPPQPEREWYIRSKIFGD